MSDSENWIDYPSGVGYEPIEFPLPQGQVGPFGRVTEAIQARNIGNCIADKIERAIEADDSFQYRGQNNSAQTLAHWVGSLEGLQIIDKPTAKRLGNLVIEFSKAERGDQKQIAKEKLRPLLSNLRPVKRQP